MIKENLDTLIMSTIKSGCKTELNVYGMIKQSS